MVHGRPRLSVIFVAFSSSYTFFAVVDLPAMTANMNRLVLYLRKMVRNSGFVWTTFTDLLSTDFVLLEQIYMPGTVSHTRWASPVVY